MEQAHYPEPIGLSIHLSREVAYTDEWSETAHWPEELGEKEIEHIAFVYRDKDKTLKIKRRQQGPEIIGLELDRFLGNTWGAVEKAILEFTKDMPEDISWKSIGGNIKDAKMTLVYEGEDEKPKRRAIIPSPLYESYVFLAE